MNPRDMALRDAREDNRTEAFRNTRRDHAAKATADARAERRLQALMPTDETVWSSDFFGCTE